MMKFSTLAAPKQGLAAIQREVLLFIAGAFLPVIALCIATYQAGGLKSVPAAPMLAMLCPAISAFVVQKYVARRPVFGPDGLGLRKISLRSMGKIMAVMGGLLFIAIALSGLLSPDLLVSRPAMAEVATHVQIPGVTTMDPAGKIAIALAVTWLLGPILNLPIMLGEELGWRGFLNPRLEALMGKRGILATGAIWGVWHAPAILLLGYNYPDSPIVGTFLFILICIELSVLFTAAMKQSGSVLGAAIMHGTLNQLAAVSMITLIMQPQWIDWLHAPVGLIMAATLAIPAWWSYRQMEG